MKVTTRRRGNVARVHVELDVAQVKILDEASQQYRMSRAEIIASALNIWLSMLPPKIAEKAD